VYFIAAENSTHNREHWHKVRKTSRDHTINGTAWPSTEELQDGLVLAHTVDSAHFHPNTEYALRVSVENQFGEGPWSEGVTFHTGAGGEAAWACDTQYAFIASKPIVRLHDGTASMNVAAVNADNVTLICSATGIPIPTTTYWYNKPTQTSEIAVTKTNSTIVSEVVLHNVRQSVTVNCVATNRLGFDEQSLTINVDRVDGK
jgi:hypothetical protein